MGELRNNVLALFAVRLGSEASAFGNNDAERKGKLLRCHAVADAPLVSDSLSLGTPRGTG
jgi:hypothetical protein